jgi:hypothetical protein
VSVDRISRNVNLLLSYPLPDVLWCQTKLTPGSARRRSSDPSSLTVSPHLRSHPTPRSKPGTNPPDGQFKDQDQVNTSKHATTPLPPTKPISTSRIQFPAARQGRATWLPVPCCRAHLREFARRFLALCVVKKEEANGEAAKLSRCITCRKGMWAFRGLLPWAWRGLGMRSCRMQRDRLWAVTMWSGSR